MADQRLTWGGNLRAQEEADAAFRKLVAKHPREPKPPKVQRPKRKRRKKTWAERYAKYRRCGDPGQEVHHRHYRTLGQERMEDLELLCRSCHENEHEEKVQPDFVTRKFREMAATF